jgi:hypothetical protein
MPTSGKKKADDSLIDKAIENSIDFERYMDETDFDSWFIDEVVETLKELGQETLPYEQFLANVKKLQNICSNIKKIGQRDFSGTENIEEFKRFLVYQLFDSKEKRLNAKCVSIKDSTEIARKKERENFEKAVNTLLIPLSHLQSSGIKSKDYWLVLFYNDLSICYSGLKNSSLSRGYAEEAIKIIKKMSVFEEFYERLRKAERSKDYTDLKKSAFLSSSLHKLYLIAVFNQAESERRSHIFLEAERHFKEIVDYGEKFQKKKLQLLLSSSVFRNTFLRSSQR